MVKIVHQANKAALEIANKAITRVELVKQVLEDAITDSIKKFDNLESKLNIKITEISSGETKKE